MWKKLFLNILLTLVQVIFDLIKTPKILFDDDYFAV